jgi:hypothetical protein
MRLISARTALLTLAALLLACSGFAAPAPSTIAFTGLLTGEDGAPLNGPQPVQLALYASVSGGTPLWSESKTVEATRGIFSTALGDTVSFPPGVDFSEALFVGVTVGSDSGAPELTPRLALQSVPYALFAQAVADGSITSAKLANDPGSLTKVSGGAMFAAGGNVGIGTSTPGAPLEVRGGAGLTGLQILPGTLFGAAKSDAATLDIPGVNGSLGVWDNFAVSGNAGIGTSDPGAKLDVRGDIRLGATGQYFAPGGDQNLQIQYGTVNADGSAAPGSSIHAGRFGTGKYSVLFPGWGTPPFPLAMVVTPFSLAAGPPTSDPVSMDIRVDTMIWTQYGGGQQFLNYGVYLTSNGQPIDAPFTVMLVRPR